MIQEKSYQIALMMAVIMHVFVLILLSAKPANQTPVLMLSTKDKVKSIAPQEPINAVSVNHTEVEAVIERLKTQRLEQKQEEDRRQQALIKQAQIARNERIKEQQQLKKLKEEAAAAAIARKKEMLAEQKRLQELAKQKASEQKRLAELQKKQQELEKKQQAQAAQLKQQQEAAKKAQALALAEQRRKAQEVAERAAARQAEESARVAGEVDKYKALIIHAISRQWILPDQVNHQLSSQFRIRLAPNGTVLDVQLIRSSGDPILDRSAQSAIYKASPLPVPEDPKAFNVFRDISLTVRPESARG